MNIRWQSHALPRDSWEVGHGLCLCTDDPDERRIVAHVPGFGWLHDGADAIVQFDPERWPVDQAAAAALRQLVERQLRDRRTEAVAAAGHILFANG